MFFDIPVTEGADTFFWIVTGLVGFVNAIAFIDKRNTDKKSDSNN
jgi:hypothetical protein